MQIAKYPTGDGARSPASHPRVSLEGRGSQAAADTSDSGWLLGGLQRARQFLPRGPGFAAGPCLLKDTMQLAAFNNNNFALGQASMQINEGLPLYLTARMAAR